MLDRSRVRTISFSIFAVCAAGFLVTCGSDTPPIAKWTVGGTVSGLTGTLVLQNNAKDDLTLTADGPFTFATSLEEGSAYAATMTTKPAIQTCSITNGTGTLSGANVTNVTISCSANAFFYATDGTIGPELWMTDGTDIGTVMVKDINPGATGSYPVTGQLAFVLSNGVLYFSANDGTHGDELWKSDGTTAGTVMVKDISSGSGSSHVAQLTAMGGAVYFTASNGTDGVQLWKSDGTDAGTQMVKIINAGGADPNYLTASNGALYFSAYNASYGQELWKSDGTDAGTVLVKDIYPGTSNSGPSYLTSCGGMVYFMAFDGFAAGQHGHDLWKSDGTAAGTQVIDINPGAGDSGPTQFACLGSSVVFRATDGTNGYEPWVSDGTSAGTLMLKDIYSDASSSNPGGFLLFNGALYFAAQAAADDLAMLWKTDGTPAGTTLVKDFDPGSTTAVLGYLVTSQTGVYFFHTADTRTHIWQIWKSDGTDSGTAALKELTYTVSAPSILARDDFVYFGGFDDDHGRELWKSDGTAAGTTLLKDLWAGPSPNSGLGWLVFGLNPS